MSKDYADQMHAVGTITVPNPAAAQSVTLGFNPRYVKAVNVNNLKMYEWFYGMAAGTSLDTGNHDTAQIAVNAADDPVVTSTRVGSTSTPWSDA